jgi:hypothetical protein
MDKQKRTFLQFLIAPEKKQRFVAKIEENGKNITDVLMEFVDSYIDESNQVDIAELRDRVEKIEGYLKAERAEFTGELVA